jgi:hypothetical protein
MDQELSSRPASEKVVSLILSSKPMHRKFLRRAITDLSAGELDEVEAYLLFLAHEGVSAEETAASYLTIVDDAFFEEMRFRSVGHYRYSTFAEAQTAVYENKPYMRRYMIGLALSSFWWSNHMKMRRFFKSQLPKIARYSGVYREVGPGHGMYFLESLRHCRFGRFEGIDISPASVEMTRRVIDSGFFGKFPPSYIIQGDFLDGNSLQPAQVLVMGEVLEHVEDPGAFLRRAHETTTEDPFVFLTTCINAPAIDHLYNPESIENLEQLFADYGFSINDKCIVPRDGAALEQCVSERLAINVAYVLGKRH